MARGVRSAVAAAALGMRLLGAAGAARADTYDFTAQQDGVNSGHLILSSGSFTTAQSPGSFLTVSSVSGYFLYGSSMVPISSYTDFIVSPQNDSFTFFGTQNGVNYSFNYQTAVIKDNPFSITPSTSIGTYSNGEYKSTGYSVTGSDQVLTIQGPDGPVNAQPATVGNETSFVATLVSNFTNPVSPGSGGPTVGSGGSGGSPGATGAAPSPEVNTLLGFLVVGGTVAFLRRRRRGAEGEGMAAA